MSILLLNLIKIVNQINLSVVHFIKITIADKATGAVTAKNSSATRTSPSDCFIFKKSSYSQILYYFEVLNKACSVLSAISFVKLLYPAAWELLTIVTKF